MNITIVGIVVIAVFVMIFLYIRGENYRRKAKQLSAALDSHHRENRYLSEVVVDLAKEEQQTLSHRFSRIQAKGSPNMHLMKNTALLIESCENVIKESTIGQKSVHDAFKKYVNNFTQGDFEEFNNFILQADAQKRQAWSKNNLHAYLELCKICMDELES